MKLNNKLKILLRSPNNKTDIIVEIIINKLFILSNFKKKGNKIIGNMSANPARIYMYFKTFKNELSSPYLSISQNITLLYEATSCP